MVSCKKAISMRIEFLALTSRAVKKLTDPGQVGRCVNSVKWRTGNAKWGRAIA